MLHRINKATVIVLLSFPEILLTFQYSNLKQAPLIYTEYTESGHIDNYSLYPSAL